MDEIRKLLDEIIDKNSLIYGVLSKVKVKDEQNFSKVTIKPVLIKNSINIQFTYHYKNKVMHKNIDLNESSNEVVKLIDTYFRQAVLFTTEADYQILISKKGKVKILKKKPTKSLVDLSHNRKKNYLIEEGKPCPFLVRLGVMNEKGKIYSKKYDKFRQINRFLEIVSDVISKVEIGESFNIVDFGCGKSYLTFALYYYLVDILGLDVNIVGLDLKKDVIDFCNKVAEDLNYDKLKFIHGDIKGFDGFEKVDMVVTLHACDTATDDALSKAVMWNAKIILSVPCCQHELFSKIKNPIMIPMLKHGIIKERLSSLVTDSIRSNVLEIMGYSTQMIEFIDMEHTPKNIMIRAIKKDNCNKKAIKEYIEFKEFWNLENLYIESVFGNKLTDLLNINDNVD
ncbi:Methyltransferase domain-containing protein [Caloranaerobacter azorensis DSM 13643]|uniref:Methyltransferase domain-containing protein n=1 Tax=Caloranaerobacter azorensis DSM 13643 TaxID=1121264 RepID=A0A1M5U5L0_9FIRM|nr:SAM-dependent methyltransferase [Caloranaerobacter azorensis]SHH57993.1 Methyltransferase domain-containing protein [Caloranaerobacter azorensis DSM 13643]